MKTCNFILFFLVILIIFSLSTPNSQSTTNTTGYSFSVVSTSTKVNVISPVFDSNLHLYMNVEAGILQNFSNPYIKLSYIDSQTTREVLSTSYIFHQLIEYTPTNNTQIGPESSTIDQVLNIGNNGSTGNNIVNRGYKAINESTSMYEGVILHTITFTTLNNIFSLSINIPEGNIYPNDIGVNIPGLFLSINVKNFPYLVNNSKLSMNVHMTTSAQDSIDIIGSNKLFIYRGYDTTYNSTFYIQNASLSGLQNQFLTPQIRDTSGYSNFQDVNRQNSTFFAYIGQVNTNPILPGSIFFTAPNYSSSKTAGILDFTLKADTFNFQITGTQLAVSTVSLAGAASILLLAYYLIRKYLMYIVGLLLGIAVSIYLPTRKVTAIQALHHEKRKEIMDALYESGGKGISMKELKELIQLPQTTLLWHLDVLQEFEFITRVKIHKQIIIISNDFLEEFDPRITELELSFLSDQGEKFRELISSKDINESFSLKDVIKTTNWHEKTAKRHLKRLITLGIIIPAKSTNFYTVTPEFHAYFSRNR